MRQDRKSWCALGGCREHGSRPQRATLLPCGVKNVLSVLRKRKNKSRRYRKRA
nr:MAG TPA: hypothetical protein [Caudoviricetes sp.]